MNGYHFIDADDGIWYFSPDGLAAAVRSSIVASAMLSYQKVEVMAEGGWFRPKLQVLDFDTDRVYREIDRQSPAMIADILSHVYDIPELAVQMLEAMHRETARNKKKYKDQAHKLSQGSMEEIKDAERRGEIVVEGLKAVRDVSGAVLMAGAVVMSGGAAAAVYAGGVGIRGVGTYQDTGSVGAAVTAMSIDAVIGVVKIGPVVSSSKGVAQSSKAVVAFGSKLGATSSTVDIARDTVVGTVSGNGLGTSFRDAVISAHAGKLLGPMVDRFQFTVKASLKQPILPGFEDLVRLTGREHLSRGGARAVAGGVAEVGYGRSVDSIKEAILASPPSPQQSEHAGAASADSQFVSKTILRRVGQSGPACLPPPPAYQEAYETCALP